MPQVATPPARDYGALIRLSNGGAVNVLRSNVDRTATGTVTIGAGAVIDGGNALMVDATRNTTLSSSALVSGAGHHAVRQQHRIRRRHWSCVRCQ